jgi:hypothetical protein
MNGIDPAQKSVRYTTLGETFAPTIAPTFANGAAAAPASTALSSGAGAASGNPGAGFSFHDLLDIVNPLQHLPVIGTLYRAITGEHIGTFEKIAGDTLYGGFWGAVSSLADTAFEKITGKDFGDTILGLLTSSHGDAPKAVAANTQLPQPAASTPTALPTADVAALSRALAAKGIDQDIAQRAQFAYQRSMSLPPNMVLAAGI